VCGRVVWILCTVAAIVLVSVCCLRSQDSLGFAWEIEYNCGWVRLANSLRRGAIVASYRALLVSIADNSRYSNAYLRSVAWE